MQRYIHSVFIAKTDLEWRLRADSSILIIDFVKYQNLFPYYPMLKFGKLVLERFTTNCPSSEVGKIQYKKVVNKGTLQEREQAIIVYVNKWNLK